MRFRTLAASGLGAMALVASVLTPATADNVDGWVAGPYTSFPNNTTVHFELPYDYSGSYVYNLNLNHPVHAGDVITFHMATSAGAYCTDYWPYVYVEINGRQFTSYDDGTPCPGDRTWTQDDGDVSFGVTEDGYIGFMSVNYYDEDGNGGGGVAEISNIRVNNEDPITFGPDPAPPPPCQGAECPHVATAFGASLSHGRHHHRCRVKTYAFLDAALEGTYADPQERTFTTRVDGHVRRSMTLAAGTDGHNRFRVHPHTGKRIITVKTEDGQLLDRMRLRTGRCGR